MDEINRTAAGPSMPVRSPLGQTAPPAASPEAVARGIESIFASMLLKQMRQNMDGESVFGKDPGDIIGGMFDQSMGDYIARAGGLGIGAMIRAQLERRSALQ